MRWLDVFLYKASTPAEQQSIDVWLAVREIEHKHVIEIVEDADHGQLVIETYGFDDDGTFARDERGELVHYFTAVHDDGTFPWPAHVLTS